jgi:hypothetical protein
MIFPSLSILLAFSVVAIAQDTSLAEVRRAFNDASVSHSFINLLNVSAARYSNIFVKQIPEAIKLSFDPKVLLEVTFPQTAARPITLHAGIQLPRNGTPYLILSFLKPTYHVNQSSNNIPPVSYGRPSDFQCDRLSLERPLRRRNS